MNDILEYEELVQAFENSLLHQLRGHNAAVAYLESWVPDEDPVRSMLNMLEAVEDAGQTSYCISFARETLGERRLADLTECAEEFGLASLTDSDGRVVLRVTQIGLGRQFRRVHPAYRATLRARISAMKHAIDGPTANSADAEVVVAEADDFRVVALVDRQTHQIVMAQHSGPDEALARIVLDYLCDVLVGTTVQEAADHAGHHLMTRLAGGDLARPVAGIALPQNADPVFARPNVLARQLLTRYRAQTGYTDTENMFVSAPSDRWLAQDRVTKKAEIRAALERIGAELGYASDALRLARIETNLHRQDVRVVIEFSPDVQTDAKPDMVRALERRLKREVEPLLELYCEEIKDKNRIRRL